MNVAICVSRTGPCSRGLGQPLLFSRRHHRPALLGSRSLFPCRCKLPRGFLEYEEKLSAEDEIAWRDRPGDKGKPQHGSPSTSGQQRAKRIAKKRAADKQAGRDENRLSKVRSNARPGLQDELRFASVPNRGRG